MNASSPALSSCTGQQMSKMRFTVKSTIRSYQGSTQHEPKITTKEKTQGNKKIRARQVRQGYLLVTPTFRD